MSLFNVAYCGLVACVAVWLVYELIWGGSTWGNHLSPQNDEGPDRGFERRYRVGKWTWW